MNRFTLALATMLTALSAFVSASARGGAPDFPPGSFSDGGHYSLEDFKGKVVVLFFYEQDCPKCRGLIPTRNEVVEKYRDKPVVFIAVGASDSLADVRSYIKGTHLEMTTFADTLGVMESRYGFHISLQNIYQFRYIGPDGNIIDQGIDLTPEKVDAALKDVKWKYRDAGYDPKLNRAIMLLEWNQYKEGIAALKPFLKTKSTAESAQKLFDAVKAEGKQWLDQAETAKESNPATAFALYSKVSTCFAGDDIAKTADAALKTLKTNKAVKDEAAASQQYEALNSAMARATPKNRAEIINYCTSIATKYPDAPSGQKAAQLAKDLQAAGLASARE